MSDDEVHAIDVAWPQETWRAWVRQLQAEVERLRSALRRIRDEEGTVCDHYEICTDESCASSYAAWVIADEALRVGGGEDEGQEPGRRL